MRLSSDNGRWMLKGVGGLGAAVLLAVACAGGDTPPRDAELVADIREKYDNAVGQAGSASMGGSGGGGGQGGSGQGGSVSNAGAGGSGVAAAGSTGGGAAGSGSGGPVCNAPVEVLIPSCGALGSSCHGAGSPFGNFGESEAAAEALVGSASNCGGLQYFNAATPQNSAVVAKLDDRPPCGSPMPLGADALSQADVDCITEWIGQF